MTPRRPAVPCLDEILPRFEQREVHSRRYRADPAELRAAFLSLDSSALPLSRALVVIRALPGLVRRRRRPEPAGRGDRAGRAGRATATVVGQMEAAGFRRVFDGPDVLAFVVIGRFWRPDGGRVAVADVEAFRRFDAAGYSKGALGVQFARQVDGSTVVITETRVGSTDGRARLLMAVYWRLIRLGSGLMRREALAALGPAKAGSRPAAASSLG